MKKKKHHKLNFEEKLNSAWFKIFKRCSNNNITISNERDLIYYFCHFLHSENKTFLPVFEKLVKSDFGKFLDVYVEARRLSTSSNKSIKTKIGMEFKFPCNSNGSSNQTYNRKAIIKDIKELTQLVRKNEIDVGVFFLATKEAAYTKMGTKTTNLKYKVFNNFEYNKDEILPGDKDSKVIKSICNIKFRWHSKGELHCIRPIFISNMQSKRISQVFFS